LAKFGYRPDVKEKNLTTLSYFGYLLEPVVQSWLVIFSPFCKIWRNEVHFSPPKKSPLYLLKSYFSGKKKNEIVFQTPPPPTKEFCQ